MVKKFARRRSTSQLILHAFVTAKPLPALYNDYVMTNVRHLSDNEMACDVVHVVRRVSPADYAY